MRNATAIERFLQRQLMMTLGVPVSSTPTDLPAGVGGYGVLEFVELTEGRAIGTRTYRYRLTLNAAEQAEESVAHAFTRTMLDRLTTAFDTQGRLRDAVPAESMLMEVERYNPREVSVRIDVEVI